MQIARIVQSASHLDYTARVLDSLDTGQSPAPGDYAFGRFVRVGSAVGIIANSQLINPEFGSYGPRLTTPAEVNRIFSPDFLNEQGVLISILLLGWQAREGYFQGVPPEVLPVNSPVETLGEDDLLSFHLAGGEGVRLAYYPVVAIHAKLLARPLIEGIIGQLDPLIDDAGRARLRVFRQTLAWRETVEGLG